MIVSASRAPVSRTIRSSKKFRYFQVGGSTRPSTAASQLGLAVSRMTLSPGPIFCSAKYCSWTSSMYVSSWMSIAQIHHLFGSFSAK